MFKILKHYKGCSFIKEQLSQLYQRCYVIRNIDKLYAILIKFGVLENADDVNLIGNDTRTIERNSDALLNTFNHIGLAVNTGKTKYMEIHQLVIPTKK